MAKIPKETLLKMYELVFKIRRFEETAIQQYRLGHIRGYLHPYLGEEAIAVGTILAAEPEDYIVSTHRGHGHALAKGHDPKIMLAELFGKSTGYCRGRGGSMHVATTATSSSSPLPQPANASANQQEPPPPVSEPAPPSPTAAAQGGTAVSQPSEPSEALQGSGAPMTPTPPAGASEKLVARSSRGQRAAQNGQVNLAGGHTGQAPEEAAVPPSQTVQATQAAAERAAAAKALEELEDRMTPLAGRANAVKDSVEHLRQQQERAGYSLRHDISASFSSMDQYMGRAEAALNSRNPEAAKKYMDLAEQEVEKLEKFFGR